LSLQGRAGQGRAGQKAGLGWAGLGWGFGGRLASYYVTHNNPVEPDRLTAHDWLAGWLAGWLLAGSGIARSVNIVNIDSSERASSDPFPEGASRLWIGSDQIRSRIARLTALPTPPFWIWGEEADEGSAPIFLEGHRPPALLSWIA
jgi:hypothetical protein